MLDAMLRVFAETFQSLRANVTLSKWAKPRWRRVRRFRGLEMAMPNKHCLLIDLSPFRMENQNEVFLPIDEPHGQIEAT